MGCFHVGEGAGHACMDDSYANSPSGHGLDMSRSIPPTSTRKRTLRWKRKPWPSVRWWSRTQRHRGVRIRAWWRSCSHS